MATVRFFSVQSDIESVNKFFQDIGDNVKRRALPQSLNQIGDKAFTQSVRTASGVLGIPQQNLRHGSAGKKGDSSKPMMTKKKGTVNALLYEIKVRSRWLHITETYFNPKQTKEGVESTYYGGMNSLGGGRYLHKGSFLGRGKNSGKILAYVPTGKFKMVQGKRKMIKRAKLKALWAFNPAREFMTKGVGSTILKEFAPQIAKRYEEKLNQYIKDHKLRMKPV
jgi:hypothetical protein